MQLQAIAFKTYHNISCTSSITFNSIITGLTTSSSGVYSQSTSQSSYVTETMATGNKYISGGPYIVRYGTTTSIYAPITMSFTTAGTVTVALGISAIRIAQKTQRFNIICFIYFLVCMYK